MKLSYDVDHNVFRAAEQGDLTELSGDVEVIEDLLPSLAKVSGTPAAGDVLEYDTTAKAWKPKSNYVKVDGTPADGDVLVYDDTSDTWKPDAPSGGGAGLFTIEVTGTWNDATQQYDVAIPEATIEAAISAIMDGEATLICLSNVTTGESDHYYEYLTPMQVYFDSPNTWASARMNICFEGPDGFISFPAPWSDESIGIPFSSSVLTLEHDSTNHVYANYAYDGGGD